jgi:hypothetical protein
MSFATASFDRQSSAVTAARTFVEVRDVVKAFVQDHFSMDVAMTTPAAMLMIDGQFVSVSTETCEYLKLEAARRGVSVVEVYREEMQAQEELKRLTLPHDRLEKAAQQDHSHHPWWSGNETKPF